MSREVAVLGGGLAGLSAALRLAGDGARVTLYERAAVLGGKAGELRAGGFRFDTGPSVVTLPEVVLGALREAGAAPLPRFSALDPLCHYRLPSGRGWDVYADAERTAAGLPPGQRPVYRRLLEEARRLYRAAAPTFVFGPAPGPGALLRYALRHGAAAHPGRSLPQLLRRSGAEADLEAFFLRFATYVGADPYRAAAVLHNVAWVELGLGVVHPHGGVRAVVTAFARALAGAGVRVRLGVRATGLELHGDRVRAVHSTAGRQRVDGVVSALDVVHSHALVGRYHASVGREASLSGVVLLLGVEGRSPGAQHQVLFSPDYPGEFAALRAGRLAEDPTLYLNVSARTDPADAPEGCENWFVMANAPALPARPRAHTDPLAGVWPRPSLPAPGGPPPLRTVDGEEPTASEHAYALHMLATLAARGALHPEAVRFWRLLGPRQLARSGHRGAIYGAAPLGLRGALRPPASVSGVRNLVLAGGTVHPGGGIPLVVLSGRRAARRLLAALA